MSNINEILAKQIADKLKEEKLISATDKQLATKLANGGMKEADWKIALEEIINKPKETTESKNEAE
jgi:hypothetical protein